jgi:hypothetical protein
VNESYHSLRQLIGDIAAVASKSGFAARMDVIRVIMVSFSLLLEFGFPR